MQVSTQLISSHDPITSLSPSFNLPKLVILKEWVSWFAAKTPTVVAYIPHIAHVAVKMKPRLIKSSIVLPLGKYLAVVHHLRLIQQTFGKDQHGLQHEDQHEREISTTKTSRTMTLCYT